MKNKEIENARAELEEKAEQLSLSSKYKSEFVANMSHELRTPLNSLLILAKLLAENPGNNLNEKQIEFARTIHNSGSDLLALINDILDLSKVEAGKMDINPADIELENIRDYVDLAFRPLADQKELTLEVHLDDEMLPTITTDEQRLQQILNNLLSNAFKFTPTGGVTMRIEAVPADSRFISEGLKRAPQVIGFSVADTGIGIPADKLRLIFEAFQQADGTTSRRYGGTGLGLSISREIAGLLGGEIHVESTVDAGSTFTLYLPATYEPSHFPRRFQPWTIPTDPSTAREDQPVFLASAVEAGPALASDDLDDDRPAADRQSTSEPSDGTAAALEGKKILIVDDDIRNVFALASALELHGVKVLYADNGSEGLELLKQNADVDLTLMDIMMPEIDGYETIKMIRAIPRFDQLPIIALTAKAMKGDREKTINAGASDYIAKPVDFDRLYSVLGAWLRKDRDPAVPRD
jgi:CheY-like chemotaxis protein/nitrogen-specific signal transduction histidine kinase